MVMLLDIYLKHEVQHKLTNTYREKENEKLSQTLVHH